MPLTHANLEQNLNAEHGGSCRGAFGPLRRQGGQGVRLWTREQMNALDRHRERDAVQRRRRQQLVVAYDIARRERARDRWQDKPLPANDEEHVALQHAAQGGLIAGPARDEHTAAVISLLELGADHNQPAPSTGLTPLQAACSVGHTGAVRALLDAKV